MFNNIKKETAKGVAAEPQTFKPMLKKRGWKLKAAFIGSGVFLVVVFAYLTLVGINSFFEHNRFVFKSPIEVKFNAPITIEARPLVTPVATQSAELKPSPTPEPKEESFHIVPSVHAEGVREIDYKTLASFIHYRESNNGTAKTGHHVTCRTKGMWNEIGYAPQQGFCFASEEEGFAKLDSWLKENVAALGISKSLCKYNSGKALADCQYYQDYLAYTLK